MLDVRISARARFERTSLSCVDICEKEKGMLMPCESCCELCVRVRVRVCACVRVRVCVRCGGGKGGEVSTTFKMLWQS